MIFVKKKQISLFSTLDGDVKKIFLSFRRNFRSVLDKSSILNGINFNEHEEKSPSIVLVTNKRYPIDGCFIEKNENVRLK